MDSVFDQIRAGTWDGWAFENALRAGMMPEYHGSCVIGSIHEHLPGECPYHLESLLDHVTWSIMSALDLIRVYDIRGYHRMTLLAAATWHDIGKMVTRLPKDRWVCPACGRSHNSSMPCKTTGCAGIPELRSVIGYHGHDVAGASPWMWGNVAIREGIREPMRSHVERLILFHSDVHGDIVRRKTNTGDPLAVLLSWADEVAKKSPPFVAMTDERPLHLFESAYLAVAKRHG